MAKLTADDAFDLANRFRDLSVAVGDFTMAQFKSLTPAQRRKLEEIEAELRVSSIDLRTKAVGLVLDDAETSLKALTQVTDRARRAIKKLDTAKTVLTIAGAALGLAAAVASRDVGGIVSNAKAVFDAVQSATDA
jgi:hypothetical protein